MSWVRRALVPARRCCSAVRLTISGGRRPQRARSAWVWASGRGRGVGRSTSAPCARARASNASVLARWPVARAQSRACRGVTTTTGSPAAAKALVTRRSRPPVAASPRRVGWRACSWATRGVTPLGSLGTAQRSPEGRMALSHWALATSRPLQHGTSLLRNSCRPDRAETGSMAPHTCAGLGRPGRDDPRAAPVSAGQGSIGLSRPGST
jgi:hypothetical protein